MGERIPEKWWGFLGLDLGHAVVPDTVPVGEVYDQPRDAAQGFLLPDRSRKLSSSISLHTGSSSLSARM